MQVLSIGYGKHLWHANPDQTRLVACAAAIDGLHAVIFSNQTDKLEPITIANKLHLYPTQSTSSLGKLLTAIKIGSRLLKEKEIDVITAQDPFEAGLVGLFLKWRYPHVRFQVQEHGDVLSSSHWRTETGANRLRYLIGLFILKRADNIRVVSKRTRDFIAKKIPRADIHQLPVVIDTKNFSAAKHAYHPDGSKETFTFLTAARFVPQKNVPLLLRAFAEARQQVPELRLRLLGEGPQAGVIRRLIEELDMSESVTVAGWTTDLGQEMSRADAYVLSSNYEGWARVLIEAMTVGVPTVTTDVGCVGEVFRHKKHGLVVPVGDRAKLAEAMVTLATDHALYASIKKQLATVSKSNLVGTDTSAYAEAWASTLR